MKEILRIVCIIILIFAIVFGIYYLRVNYDILIYNNGNCTHCDGHYILKDIEMSKNNVNHYYYICDNCGHLIETIINMKQGDKKCLKQK